MTNFVILNSGSNTKLKSYGPRSLIRLKNRESILERQIRIIHNYFPDARIIHGLGDQYQKFINSGHIYECFINEHFDTTNQLYSLAALAQYFKIKDTFVLFGDIVFDERHFPNQPVSNVVYTRQNFDKNKVGITATNGILDYMMWGLPITWAEVSYFNEGFIDFIISLYEKPHMTKAFLIEAINTSPYKFDVEPLGSEVINIEKYNDIHLCNRKFNIE